MELVDLLNKYIELMRHRYETFSTWDRLTNKEKIDKLDRNKDLTAYVTLRGLESREELEASTGMRVDRYTDVLPALDYLIGES